LLVVALTVLTAAPARAEYARKTQWVLATAKANGVGGAQFVSSLRITNEFNTAASVTITYYAQSPFDSSHTANGANTSAPSTTVSVGPMSTAAFEDVLGTLFGSSLAPWGIPAGGFLITSDVPVSVISRTYVANGLSATGVPGTYGFSIPGTPGGANIAVGDTAVVSYISASPNQTSGFRSNFIMLNTGASSAVLDVQLLTGADTSLGERTYTLAAHGAAQEGNIASSFGFPGPDTNLFLRVTVLSGGPVLIGASIIDNAISSLNFVPGDKISTFPDNGAWGTIFTDDDRTFGGRLEVFAGVPSYFNTNVVLTHCSQLPNQFPVQMFAPGYPGANTTLTRVDTYTYSYSGGDANGHWTGTFVADWKNELSGTLTYTPSVGGCSGVSQTFHWLGGAALTSVPD
jgi:hypothetical protein